MMNLKNFRVINLNSFILIIFLILFLKNVSSIENKILFKINDYAFTSYDYEMRIRYLDFIGGEKNANKKLIIIKNGDHSLSNQRHLGKILKELKIIIENVI